MPRPRADQTGRRQQSGCYWKLRLRLELHSADCWDDMGGMQEGGKGAGEENKQFSSCPDIPLSDKNTTCQSYNDKIVEA
ncbi:tRNA N6-adenosine threonylcarbamoyltransferase [Frankliniella fusca]|uniref:tRNA N6-adenosine threonylcarbamoyltransferase n=1 Tax=Frankliniella fusca TaxID=407009 RepID=A0AAE1LPR9_9NEOP|nr:tRNA N6-adenosine threonylcarbamoyltransferase [Frankliniella fusca]